VAALLVAPGLQAGLQLRELLTQGRGLGLEVGKGQRAEPVQLIT
jgi:hypothetical protein